MSSGTRSGRPRDSRVDEAIVLAALDLMTEGSIADLRMDAIAERAGVGKAAIYRRFGSKDELVASVLGELLSEITIPDTGSTREDLIALMRDAVALYRRSHAGDLVPALIEAMRRDRELARAVRDRVVTERRRGLRGVLERGIERGELDPDLDFELTLDVLAGPLFYRLLITRGPLDERLVQGTVDLILKGNSPTKEPHK